MATERAPFSIRWYVAKALSEARGDRGKAVDVLYGWAQGGEAEGRLADTLMFAGARAEIWNNDEPIRKAAENGWKELAAQVETTPKGQNTRSGLDENRASLTTWMLFGRELGDYVRPELVEALQRREQKEKTIRQRNRWLSLVVKALPDDETPVRQALRDETLEGLWRKAGRAR